MSQISFAETFALVSGPYPRSACSERSKRKTKYLRDVMPRKEGWVGGRILRVERQDGMLSSLQCTSWFLGESQTSRPSGKLCRIPRLLFTLRGYPVSRLLLSFPSYISSSMWLISAPSFGGMLPISNSCSQRTELGYKTGQHVQLLPSLSPLSRKEAKACQISPRLPLPASPPPHSRLSSSPCQCVCRNGRPDAQAIS